MTLYDVRKPHVIGRRSPKRMSLRRHRTIAHMRWTSCVATACAVLCLPAAAACPEVNPAALQLSAVLARGVCLDPRVAQQRAEIERNQGAVSEAAAASAWQWSLRAGPAASVAQGSGGGQRSGSASGSVVASRTLADGGLTRARTSQRERDEAAARADLDSTQQDSLRELAGLWSDAREAEAAVTAARGSLEAARASDAAVQARFAAGTATRVDTLSAASALAQAERELLSAQATWLRRQGVLAERLGLAANVSLVLESERAQWLQDLASRLDKDPATNAAQLGTHPQAVSQAERVASRRAALEATRAEDGPTLSLSGSTGPQWSHSNVASRTGSYESTTRWNSELGLTWSKPLSDGGARRARSTQGQAQLDAALAQQASVQRSLREGLWQQWTAWQSAPAELRAAQTALAAAQAAERAQRGRYEAGAGTLAEWITAQSDLAARTRQAAVAEQSQLRAAVGAVHALGNLRLEEPHAAANASRRPPRGMSQLGSGPSLTQEALP
jgi:outer membrane protein